jgi:hypothetical protein
VLLDPVKAKLAVAEAALAPEGSIAVLRFHQLVLVIQRELAGLFIRDWVDWSLVMWNWVQGCDPFQNEEPPTERESQLSEMHVLEIWKDFPTDILFDKNRTKLTQSSVCQFVGNFFRRPLREFHWNDVKRAIPQSFQS